MPAMQPPETIIVETGKLFCDGVDKNGEPGHPRVFLTMTRAGSVDCPYCGRHFVLREGAVASAGH